MAKASTAPNPLPHTAKGRKAPPLVLIHGLGMDRHTWTDLMGPLSALRRTIAVDLPGHGEAAAWPEPVNAVVCAKAIIATLDLMGVQKATLVGHSLGGAAAALVGLMRPDVMERLVLLAPGGFGREMNVRLLRRYAVAADEATMAMVLEQFFGPDRAVPQPLVRALAAARWDPALAVSLATTMEALVSKGGQGTLPLDKLAAAPFATTLVWGNEDTIVPVAQAQSAPVTIARHILPDIGHMVHLEAPELTVDLIARTVLGKGVAA